MAQEERTIFICHTGMDTYMGLSDTTYLFSSEDIERAKTQDPDVYSSLDEAQSAKELARNFGLEVRDDLAQLLYEITNQYHIHGGNIRVNIAPYNENQMVTEE